MREDGSGGIEEGAQERKKRKIADGATRPGSNFNDSLPPLTTLQAIFGYAVFQYPRGKPRLPLSIVHAILVTLVYWGMFLSKIDHSFNGAGKTEKNRKTTEDKVVFAIVHANLSIAALTQLFHWYYYKKFEEIVKRITKVDESLGALGATFDHARDTRNAYASIVCWVVMIVFDDSFDALWFYGRLPVGEAIPVVCLLHYPIHVNAMVSLHYALIIRHVHHLELTVTARDFQRVFGPVVSLEMAAYFVMFTGLLYSLYATTVLAGSSPLRLLRITVVVTVIVSHVPILAAINHACEKTTGQAKRTGRAIDRIGSNGERDSELNAEIKQFHLQLMTNRLTFSPLGFFALGYGFLRGFFASVATYLVILVQMSGDPRSREQR